MAATKINLDRQAEGKTVALGTTSASGQALLTLNNGTAAATNTVLDVKGSASIAGDLALTGNLNITGSIDEQSVTNLAVKDLTITTNKGGTTAGATGAGLKVEGDSAATIAAITYASGSATKFQIGNGSTQVDIVDTSTAQTLTNKSISGGQITSAVANATAATTATTATKSTNIVGGNNTTQLGAMPYQSNTDTTSLLAPNTSSTKKFVVMTGTGTNGAAPTWDTIAAADVPTLNQSTTGNAATATKSTNLAGGNSTTLLGTIPYQSNTDTTTLLTPNTTTTKKFLTQTGTGTNGAAPGWNTLVASDLGTGTANSSTYLKGDLTWGSVSTGTSFTRTTITGTINGSNTAFTLGVTPNPVGSEQIFQNGVLLNPGSGNDYTITGTGVTFATAPATGDILQAFASS